MKPSWCPKPNVGLIWDLTADVELEESDDESLHDLAMIHHLLFLNVKKQSEKTTKEPSEGNFSSDWMKTSECLAASCGLEGHVCETGHCLETLAEQHCQLTRLFERLSMSDRSEMELIADCHGVTEVNLVTALGFYTMTCSMESLEHLERAHEFQGRCEQKIESWRGISQDSWLEVPGGIQFATILQQQLSDAPADSGCQNAASVD